MPRTEPHPRSTNASGPVSPGPESGAATMPAVVIRGYATPPVVSVETIPVLDPAPGQVRIRVEAAALNPLDWHLATGTPWLVRLSDGLRRPRRTVPGADIAGVVTAVGEGVAEHGVGDRVVGEAPGGGCAAVACVDATTVVAIPDTVGFDAAAAVPVAGLTALQGLRTHGRLEAGERVLINGAAGGVGTFAVQLAKVFGAEVTAVCSTANVERIRGLGADRVVDYRTEDLLAVARAEGLRFDLVLDNVGSFSPKEIRSLLTDRGRLVVVSGSKGNRVLGPAAHLARSLLSFALRPQTCRGFIASPNAEDLEVLLGLVADGSIEPQIHRVVGLDGVGEALAEIGRGHTPAKIVVRPDPGPGDVPVPDR